MGYFDLIKRIVNSKEYTYEFYNQIKRTSSNRRTIDSIRQTLNSLNSISDYTFNIYLYQDGKCYQLDLYSSDCYEGSIRDSNLKQLSKKFKGICLKIKHYLKEKLISVQKNTKNNKLSKE